MSFDPHMSKKPDPRSQVKTVDVEIKTQSSFFGKLRAYFFTGLVITAPIAITIWATFWFVTLFDARVKAFLPDIYNPDTYLPIKIPGFGLIFARHDRRGEHFAQLGRDGEGVGKGGSIGLNGFQRAPLFRQIEKRGGISRGNALRDRS